MTSEHDCMPADNDYSDHFVKYVLEWTEEGIKTTIDGNTVLDHKTPAGGMFNWGGFSGDDIWASGTDDAPFDQEFYLIINLAVGSTNGYMPDGCDNAGGAKPWNNADGGAASRNFWWGGDTEYNERRDFMTSWSDPTFKVREIKVFSADEDVTQSSTTQESTTAESTSESTTSESTTAESTTVDSTTAESTTAESTTAETTSESTTPESTTSESTTTESTTAESTTSESTTKETTTESTTAESTTSESTTADSTTSETTSQEACTDNFVANFDDDFVHGDQSIRPFGSSASKFCAMDHQGIVKIAECKPYWPEYSWAYSSNTKQVRLVNVTEACWTAQNTGTKRQTITIATCDSADKLQKFVQVNGRIHLNANQNLCAGYATEAYATKYKSNSGSKTQLVLTTCKPQLLGEDLVDSDSCQEDSWDHNSAAKLVNLQNSKNQITVFKKESNADACLFRSGSKAKFGKCKNKFAYKFSFTSGKVKTGRYCLTASSTSKAGTPTFVKCSNKKSTKKKQQWNWSDGRLVLKNSPKLAVQYPFQNVKKGKTVTAKTGLTYNNVFGDVFYHH